MERYLLGYGPLADATPEEIIERLRPSFRMLAGG